MSSNYLLCLANIQETQINDVYSNMKQKQNPDCIHLVFNPLNDFPSAHDDIQLIASKSTLISGVFLKLF